MLSKNPVLKFLQIFHILLVNKNYRRKQLQALNKTKTGFDGEFKMLLVFQTVHGISTNASVTRSLCKHSRKRSASMYTRSAFDVYLSVALTPNYPTTPAAWITVFFSIRSYFFFSDTHRNR